MKWGLVILVQGMRLLWESGGSGHIEWPKVLETTMTGVFGASGIVNNIFPRIIRGNMLVNVQAS